MSDLDAGWTQASQFVDDLQPVVIAAGVTAIGQALCLTSDTADVRIGFPWWDRRSDAQPFFDWLRTCADGATFNDLDQGWQLDAQRLGDVFHVLDRDFESGEVRANVATGRAAFLARLDEALVTSR